MEDVDIHAPRIAGRKIKRLMYAEDVALLAGSEVGLSTGLKRLEEYCDKWDLKVNVGKTRIMVVKKERKKIPEKSWWYKSRRIEVTDRFNYFEVGIKDNWTWV